MNTARIQQIKVQKVFRKWDILLYALLFLLIISLFYFFRFSAQDISLQGIEVYYEDRDAGESLIFSYDFVSDEYTVDSRYEDKIKIEKTDDGYNVDIFYGTDGYNLLRILHAGEAYIVDANCSSRKDCTAFEHITKGNMVIICVPHHLKIVGIGPSGETPDENPMIG